MVVIQHTLPATGTPIVRLTLARNLPASKPPPRVTSPCQEMEDTLLQPARIKAAMLPVHMHSPQLINCSGRLGSW
jgi:hypothetical protein